MENFKDCSICLEKIIQQDRIHFCCNQNYHFVCIKKWTDLNYTCPICRKLLDKKVLTMLRKIQNNINELKIHEEKTHHIIKTLILDHEHIKQKTQNNLEKISNLLSYTNPHIEIPSSPVLNHNNPLTFSRLLHRRGAIVLPIIIEDRYNRNLTNNCAYPAFCRCYNCLNE